MPVYFIQDESGPIKIGHTAGNPHSRLSAFRTGNPRDMKLLVAIPGGAAEEAALHERFAALRVSGEWFRPDPRLIGFIEALQYAYGSQQPKPEPEFPEDLFGLHSHQVWALIGLIAQKLLAERADKLVQDMGGYEWEDPGPELLSQLVDTSVLIEAEHIIDTYDQGCAMGRAKQPHSKWLGFLSGDNPGDRGAIDGVRKIIERHNHAVAEEQLPSDNKDGCDPVTIGTDPDGFGPLDDPTAGAVH